MEEEAPDRPLWITRFGRGYGPGVRQTDVVVMMMLFYTVVSLTVRMMNPWHACPMLHGKRPLLAQKRIWFVPYFHTKKKAIVSQEQQKKSPRRRANG